MATQTKSDPITDSVEAAAERVADLNEKAVAPSKKASEAYLSSYEKAVVALADTYEKATGATQDRVGRQHRQPAGRRDPRDHPRLHQLGPRARLLNAFGDGRGAIRRGHP